MQIKHKKVLVYGLSLSGEWVAKLLQKKGTNVFLFDDNAEKIQNKTFKKCYFLHELNKNLISQFDFIVVSPSIEKDNVYLSMANELKIKIYSELEFAAQFCKKMVAITGTNGKTTTTQLITAMLSTKHKAVACGNIGYPLSRAVLENKTAIKVVEVSSFMLEHAETFMPNVASVLNITPDHLIRHKTMEEYKRLKMSIFKNLSLKDFAVVNLDDKIDVQTNAKIVTYSYKPNADVHIKNGAIYLHNEKVIELNQLHLKGKHNIYNVMCAICYAYIYKVPVKKMQQALISYMPEKYRAENIGKVNGINFINDSKSTNIASTIACVESTKGAIILLLGGSKKGLDYAQLFNQLSKRVKQLIVFGEIANDLLLANDNKFEIKKFNDLKQSFEYATSIALKNDTILLSPASASYDQFANYIERGKAFDQMVKQYEVKTKKK